MRSAPAARRRVELADARYAAHAPRFAVWRAAVLADVRQLPPAVLVGGAFAGGAVLGRMLGMRRLLTLIAIARSAPMQHIVAACRAPDGPDGG